MIRRQFIKLFGQLSIIAFALRGQTEERIISDLTPVVEPDALVEFKKMNTVSSAPLSSGPLCGSSFVGTLNE